MDAYLQHMAEAGNAPRSIKAVTNFLAMLLPNPAETLGEIGPGHYEALRKRPGRKGPVTAATHQRALRCGRSFLTWCQERGWVKSNTLVTVKPVGKARKGKVQLRVDEARKWVRACEQLAADHDGALGALMCLQLALRVSEVCERQVRDLDDVGRVLMVRGKASEVDIPLLLDGPQLPPDEREALRPLRELLRQRAAGKDPIDLLVPVTPMAITYWARRACKAAGVPVVCPHALRGMHSTFARERGITPGAVAWTLRHSESIDRQHYAAPGSSERGERAAFFRVMGAGTETEITVPGPVKEGGSRR